MFTFTPIWTINRPSSSTITKTSGRSVAAVPRGTPWWTTATASSFGLDSSPGEGSRFHIRLPAPLASVATDTTDDVSGGRLVIAEDDPDIVQLMELFLSRAGYSIEFAGNGRDAVEMVRTAQPDLVILDLNMPVLDGIGAVRELRDGGHAGPVIALTGATLDQDRIEAIAAGFDGFVAKPIRMPELIATIRTLLA